MNNPWHLPARLLHAARHLVIAMLTLGVSHRRTKSISAMVMYEPWLAVYVSGPPGRSSQAISGSPNAMGGVMSSDYTKHQTRFSAGATGGPPFKVHLL